MLARLATNWAEIGQLGVKDWWHDRRMSLLLIASLTSVIAPLLLLFALKSGVVNQLLEELRKDPANLEVRIRGNWQLDDAWLQALQSQHFVQFAVPMTRSLNLSMDLLKDRRQFARTVELIPTADREPLFAAATRVPQAWNQLVLVAPLAEKLGVSKGDNLKGMVTRTLKGQLQRQEIPLTLVDVVDTLAVSDKSAFVTVLLLQQIEAYKDGLEIPIWNGEAAQLPEQPARSYAKARIYAASLEQVMPLVSYLEAQDLPVRSSQQAIAQVQAITRVLATIFWVVAATAIIGCVASMIGAFVANVERKRKEVAMLRLLGFGAPALNGYLMLQALLTALIAYAVGALLSRVACGYLNQTLAFGLDQHQLVCRVSSVDWTTGLALTLLTAAASALFAGLRAIRIQPAEVLREQ